MIDAGINEGDIIICKRCDTAENGDIVVALVEKEEATLEAAAQERRLDRTRSRQSQLRDAHLRPRPGRHPGPPGGSHPPLLKRTASCHPRACPEDAAHRQRRSKWIDEWSGQTRP